MARRLVLLSVLVFVVAACYAPEPAGLVYWNKVLPNTPMPSAIKDLLTSDFSEDKSTAVNVGKGGVAVNTGKGTNVNVGHGSVGVNTGKGTSVNVGKGGSVGVNTGKGTGVNVGHGGVGVGVNTGKGKPGSTRVNVGKGGVGVGVKVPPKKKPVNVNVSGFKYNYAATETQLHDDPNVALFFLEKDLRPGTKMTLHFTPTTSGAAFISLREANSVPFSSTEFPQILSHFSVDPNSAEAEAMKSTLTECEDPAMAGESKYCATSLESMVEFSTLSLGTRNVAAVSTTVDKQNSPKQQYTIQPSTATTRTRLSEEQNSPKQQYTTQPSTATTRTRLSGEQNSPKQQYTAQPSTATTRTRLSEEQNSPSGVKKLSGSNNLVVCHSQSYAYAVFYCHNTHSTRAYQVSMVGEDGTKVEAAAVCHTDTAGWNPKHVAFQVLGVKPGSVPVCHFLPQDHVIWSPKK